MPDIRGLLQMVLFHVLGLAPILRRPAYPPGIHESMFLVPPAELNLLRDNDDNRNIEIYA